MWMLLDNILCDQGQGHKMYFLVNPSSKLLDIATSNLQVHRSYDLEGTGQHFV